MKFNLFIDTEGDLHQVGLLESFVSEKGNHNFASEFFRFQYDKEWLLNGFELSPDIPLNDSTYEGEDLPLAFNDAMPDSWGEKVLRRIKNSSRPLLEIEYLLGASDFFRMGSFRISLADDTNQQFFAQSKTIPTIKDIPNLQKACRLFETKQITEKELSILNGSATSLGGAMPKVVVLDESEDSLYLAKFQTRNAGRRIALWEATALDLASLAGIQVCQHKVLNAQSEEPVFLTKRFDRDSSNHRIHFASVMTLAGISIANIKGNSSYVEIADLCYKHCPVTCIKDNLKEMWKRMVFNACVGNVDDHARNHGFLRVNAGWILSPAYDIVPNPKNGSVCYEHAMDFEIDNAMPSMALFKRLGSDSFGLTDKEMDDILEAIGSALRQWRGVAKSNGMQAKEIKHLGLSFTDVMTMRVINVLD